MKLRQGRIGRQETLAAAAVAVAVSGIFTTDNASLYGEGNSAYVSTPIAAALALLAFLLVAGAMQKGGHETLWELLKHGLGGIAGRIAAFFYAGLLVFCAAALLSRFSLMLGRFVYPDASEWQVLLYPLAAAFALAWLGLEGIGRMSRLFAWVMLISILGALALAAYNYEPYRLAPILGDGFEHMAFMAVRNVALYFPGMLSLLILARGVHGVRAARRAGYGAGIAAGVLGSLCQICLGMTYTYQDLALMHSPMYRLTMSFRSGGYYQRLDLLLLMGWVISGMLAAGYYLYAAALLFAEAFSLEDIRPAVLTAAAAAGAASMLMHVDNMLFRAVGSYISLYGWIYALVPVLLASLISVLRNAGSPKKEVGA
ncbi:MAG TPA: GerAB/ArcD/ProY family transporter [Feifaniaceae bacterium]|nr:GerAB/ArcD/ProY family transporter [Feifaniaceae bacterium]